MTEKGVKAMQRDQIDIFARGLYHLASVDGIDASEIEVIKDFLAEVGAPEVMEGLSDRAFDLNEAYDLLETVFLRRVFIKAAIVLVRADGKLSDQERAAITEVADAFGQLPMLGELEESVSDVTSFN